MRSYTSYGNFYLFGTRSSSFLRLTEHKKVKFQTLKTIHFFFRQRHQLMFFRHSGRKPDGLTHRFVACFLFSIHLRFCEALVFVLRVVFLWPKRFVSACLFPVTNGACGVDTRDTRDETLKRRACVVRKSPELTHRKMLSSAPQCPYPSAKSTT